jgi:hypothetical protein
MSLSIDLVLLVLALICFVASTFGVTSKANLQSAGLALWVLSILI